MKLSVVKFAASGLVLALAACGSAPQHPAAKPSHSTSAAATPTVAALPPQCRQVMRDVSKVAKQAGVNLAFGSMSYNGPLGGGDNGFKWATELLAHAPKNGIHSPSPQVRQLSHDLIRAAIKDFVIRTNADATRFVAALQQIVADCRR